MASLNIRDLKIRGAAFRTHAEARVDHRVAARRYLGDTCVSCGRSRDPRQAPICPRCSGLRSVK